MKTVLAVFQMGQHRMTRWLDYLLVSFSSAPIDWFGINVPQTIGSTHVAADARGGVELRRIPKEKSDDTKISARDREKLSGQEESSDFHSEPPH